MGVVDTTKKTKVAVGLSGGVDSSVAAYLLKRDGFDVIGVHMLRWNTDIPGCTGDQDRADALRVAKQLDIPFRVVDFRNDYQHLVIDRFLGEFQQGRTPNPDIWCNEFIKFGVFQEYALGELGTDMIATGHYAQVDHTRGLRLLAGVDPKKDQSYFLYRLQQEQLSKTLFPLGEYTKDEIRKIAKRQRLETANKPDSVGICFIGDIDLNVFLREHLDIVPGDVVDGAGAIIGRHDGIPLYTVGQRHGFTLNKYFGFPLYVIGKDVERNRLIVGRNEESRINRLIVDQLHWIDPTVLTKDHIVSSVTVRVRHLGELLRGHLTVTGSMSDKGSQAEFVLEKPMKGLALGQHAVFYHDQQVLGGGVISQTLD